MTNIRRYVIVSMAVVVGGLLVSVAILSWLTSHISAQADKIKEAREFIARRSQIFETLAELKKAAPEATRYKEQMDILLPNRDQLFDFPRWLEEAGRVRRLEVLFAFGGGQVDPTGNAAGYTPFRLTVEGSLNNIVAFMKDLEAGAQRFIIDVENFDFGRRVTNYALAMSGRVFFKE